MQHIREGGTSGSKRGEVHGPRRHVSNEIMALIVAFYSTLKNKLSLLVPLKSPYDGVGVAVKIDSNFKRVIILAKSPLPPNQKF